MGTKIKIELDNDVYDFLLSLIEKTGEASLEEHPRKCQMIMETIPYSKLAKLKQSIKSK